MSRHGVALGLAPLILACTLFVQDAALASDGPLTGSWTGFYEYTDGRPPVRYVIMVVHDGDRVFGLLREPATFDGTTHLPWLHAVIKGTHNAQTGEFRFTKIYDGTGGQKHPVYYTGRMSADGATFSGTWEVPVQSRPSAFGEFTFTRTRGTGPGQLAGVWAGEVHYLPESQRQADRIAMVLVHDDSGLTGYAIEPNRETKPDPYLHADMRVRFNPDTRRVTFTKTFDKTGKVEWTVDLAGRVAADLDTISGTWQIPKSWGSRFTLRRQTGDAAWERLGAEIERNSVVAQ